MWNEIEQQQQQRQQQADEKQAPKEFTGWHFQHVKSFEKKPANFIDWTTSR